MSRNYEVQVEIFPCAYKDEGRVSDALVEWGMEIDSDVESFDNDHCAGWCYWGCIQFTCDQTLEQRHEQLRVLLPDRDITTRWRYVDDLPWDDVIETDPLKPRK